MSHSLSSVTASHFDLDEQLTSLLEKSHRHHTHRSLPDSPTPSSSFSSNDYLGLSSHPQLIRALKENVETDGLGERSARLISGNASLHQLCEEKMAHFKKTEKALLFPTGYMAALGTLQCLLQAGDFIVMDKWAHASLIQGSKLSSASLRVFSHNDITHLESILSWIRHHYSKSRILIVTESVYSMDGDFAPLAEICHLKEKYGAWLMVDEAHGTGILGPQGRGLCHQLNLSSQIEIQMCTLGKALGTMGGAIAGSGVLIDYLLNHAKPFIYTTAPPPCLAAATLAALDLVESTEGDSLRQQLHSNIHFLNTLLNQQNQQNREPNLSPIFPFLIGDEEKATLVAQKLSEQNIYLPAIRYPTVPKHQARLRISLTAKHTQQEIEKLYHSVTTAIKSF